MTENTKNNVEAKKEKNFLTGLFEFFCSLKLAIYIFILLAALSILGTIIQQEGTESYRKIVTNLGFSTVNFLKFFRFIEQPKSMEEVLSYGERTYKLFHSIGLMDMYHSWWFTVLLVLLSINLLSCSIKRLPGVLKYFSQPQKTFQEGLNGEIKLKTRKSVNDAKKTAEEVLGKKYSKRSEENVNEACHLFFQKGLFGRLGVYLTHFSILFIFIGSIIGSIFGFKGYLDLLEGEQSSTYWDRGKNAELPLGFTLKCEKAYVTYYKGTSGRPQDWHSELTVLKDNKVMASKRIEVNDPLSYNGIYFYQSNFGEGGAGKMRIEVAQRAGVEKKSFDVDLNEGFDAGMGVKAVIRRFIPDFTISGKEFVSRSNELNNPAVLLDINDNGKNYSTWIFLKYPDFHPFTETPFSFRFAKIFSKNQTGLQVTYDPGVILVWIGSVLLVIGLYISFFLPHKRIWVKIDKSGLAIAGLTNKNKPSFELEMEGLVSKLKGALK